MIKVANYLSVKYSSEIEEVDEDDEFYPELLDQHGLADLINKGIMPNPEGSEMNATPSVYDKYSKVELPDNIKKEIIDLNKLSEKIDELYSSGNAEEADKLDFIFEQKSELLENYLMELESEPKMDLGDDWDFTANNAYELENQLASIWHSFLTDPYKSSAGKDKLLEHARLVVKDITNSNNIDKVSDEELLDTLTESYKNRVKKLNVWFNIKT